MLVCERMIVQEHLITAPHASMWRINRDGDEAATSPAADKK
jgi:hypothetical protein